MNANSFLEQLGVFLRPGFLSPAECRELIAGIRTTAHVPGGLYEEGEETKHDADVRQVSEVAEKVAGASDLKERVRRLRPEVERHFETSLETSLEEIEGPTLLAYEPGDFFLPHTDSGKGGLTKGRKVTVVIYLNSPQSPEGEGYQGADLSLFGLMSFPGAENHGLPVAAETGLLVAFPSDMRHGVDKLVSGARYCAVCWYR